MKEEKRLNKPDRCGAFPVATLEGEGYYYTENNDLYRIGVTLNPEPIMTIEGKEYRIEREIAERYRDLWEKSAK